MNKDFEDAELDKLLKEQYVREADLIERALFSDEDIDNNEITDEEVNASYEKLMARLKAEGLCTEDAADEATDDAADDVSDDTPEEKVVSMPEYKEDKRAGKKNYYKLGRVAAIAVTCVLGVFAASMTSEANRNYVIDTLHYWAGEDTQILIDNDENNDSINKNESDAKLNIEKMLNIKLPCFHYRPMGFEYRSYEVDSVAKVGTIEYIYGENIITVHVKVKDEKTGSGNVSLHGDKIKTTYMKADEIPINILEVKDEADKVPTYVAQWECNSVFYQISGKMEEPEFDKLVEKMGF